MRAILAILGILMVAGVAAYSFTSSRALVVLNESSSATYEAEGSSSLNMAVGEDSTTPSIGDEIIVRAQDSRESFRRLAEGQVKELIYTGAAEGSAEEQAQPVTIVYPDGSLVLATFTYVSSEDDWILAKAQANDGEAAATSIPELGDEEKEMGQRIVETQSSDDSQSYVEEAMSGKIERLSIKSSTESGEESARQTKILNGVIEYSDGKQGTVQITMEELNGYWYVVEVDGS